jgi:hypothetical protein
MDEDEIRAFAEGRPPAPPYRAEAREQARERLLAEARRGGRFRLPRFGLQAVAAFGVTVVLVGGVGVTLSGQGAGTARPAVSLTRSAALWDELNPQPGQFILIESDTMYGSFSFGENGVETRHLYRTHRKIWQSVDGSKDGLLLIESREPKPWPGRELPEGAKVEGQGSSWGTLASCPDRLGDQRRDYAYLSKLPADAGAMRERLYNVGGANEDKGVDADAAAFTHVGDLARETYMPKAQRAALFEAAKGIPGVEVAEGVADSAGRKGVALGRMDTQGTLTQIIFDPATHMLLGERQTVVEDKGVDAPAGSVLALTAQLNVSVVDELPRTPTRDPGDVTCASPQTPPPASPPVPPSSSPWPTSSPNDSPWPTSSPNDSPWPTSSPNDSPWPTSTPTKPPAPLPSGSAEQQPVRPTRTVTAPAD